MPNIEIQHGFVLTTRTRTSKYGDKVEIWVATENGPRCLVTPYEKPVCFILQQDKQPLSEILSKENLHAEIQDTQLRTLTQLPTSSVKLTSERQLYTLKRAIQHSPIELFEADIKLADRYLMERFIYGALRYQGQVKGNDIVDVKVMPSDFRPKLKTLSLDIECDEHGQLYSIGLAGNDCHEVILIDPNAQTIQPNSLPFTLTVVDSEKALLLALIQTINYADPDVILGWNIRQFDMVVLDKAAKRLGVALTLGRQNTRLAIREWEAGRVMVDLPGRAVVDGIESLKSMTYHFESFSLNHVANELLNKGKLIEESDRLGAIKALYQNDKLALAKYNYQDCELVNDIATHTKFIDFLILRSTLTGLQLSRPGGSVAAFLNVYLPKVHRGGYISPNRPNDGGLASPGGYVMNSKPGLYKHVLVLDFKSLYPSIIRTFKIDPMGLAEGLKTPENAIPGYKGAVFSRKQHYLPDIITSLWAQRDEAKKHKDAPLSQAIKILMNSFYGVLGSGGCPFYDTRLASSITMRGHFIMQTTAQWIEELGHEVIYGDTDSTFVHLSTVSDNAAANAIGKQLETIINQKWGAYIATEFGIENQLEIEFETHFSTFFMPTIRGAETGSKKRYAGIKQQGNEEQLIFKGLETVRSDWTTLAKDFQQTLYLKVFKNEPVDAYIRNTLESLKAGQLDDKLIYAKRLRKPLAHYVKNVPPHVKAARIADEQNSLRGKPLQYTNSGAVKYVVSTQGARPIEYIDHPIDYDHYIEKQLQPIADSILPLIGLNFSTIQDKQIGLF